MQEFCWILLCLLIFLVLAFFLALLPAKEDEDDCKENPRFRKGFKEHRIVPYKMELKLYGGIPSYIVYYKCKYCGKEFSSIRYRQEELKGERLSKYSKKLNLEESEIILEK